jgi:hypothetical protein
MKSLLICFIFVVLSITLISQVAKAEDLNLTCENFTGDKLTDCNYLMDSGLSYEDEQTSLNILYEQPYTYDGAVWSFNIPIQNNATLPKREINAFDLNNLILASKIFFFGLINYIAYSVTKSNMVLKWLTAV